MTVLLQRLEGAYPVNHVVSREAVPLLYPNCSVYLWYYGDTRYAPLYITVLYRTFFVKGCNCHLRPPIELNVTTHRLNVLWLSYSCIIERLLGNATIQTMGAGTTCEWADDSKEVVVYYEEGSDDALKPNSTISLLGG